MTRRPFFLALFSPFLVRLRRLWRETFPGVSIRILQSWEPMRDLFATRMDVLYGAGSMPRISYEWYGDYKAYAGHKWHAPFKPFHKMGPLERA